MVYCCASGCRNHNNTKNMKTRLTKEELSRCVTFHAFPKDSKRRTAWIEAVGYKDWQPTALTVLCSAHFKDECYEKFTNMLRKDAVPTIFPGFTSNSEKSSKKVPLKRKRESPDPSTSGSVSPVPSTSGSVSPVPSTSSTASVPSIYGSVSPVPSTSREREILPVIMLLQPPTQASTISPIKKTMVSRSTSPMPRHNILENAPEVILLKKTLDERTRVLTTKIRSLQQTILRQNKKISTLKDVLSTFKKENINSVVEKLNIITGGNDIDTEENESILRRQLELPKSTM